MCQQPDTADNYTRTNIKLYSLGQQRHSPQNHGYDGQQSLPRLSNMHISRQKEMWIRANYKNTTKENLQKLQHRKLIRVQKGVCRNAKTGDKMLKH